MKKSLLLGLGIATLALGGAAFGARALAENNNVEVSATGTKTLYLCVNWGDWSSPKIHYWGGASGTSWDSLPSLTLANKYASVSNYEEGQVYTFELPTDITHFLITKSDKSAQTANFELGTTWGSYTYNSFSFVWDDVNSKNTVVPATGGLKYFENGYYIAGDANFISAVGNTGTAWKLAPGVKMDDATMVGSNKATAILTVGEDDIEFKCIKLTDGALTWLGSNLTITATGNFVVYVNGSDATSYGSGVYIDAFSASFLADMQGICGTAAAEWEKNHAGDSLNAVWAKHKARFESGLVDGQKALFITSSENAGVARAAGLYVHCATRYSLTAWTGGPAATKVASSVMGQVDNGGTIATVVLVTVGLAALLGVTFFSRKRKHN